MQHASITISLRMRGTYMLLYISSIEAGERLRVLRGHTKAVEPSYIRVLRI